MAVDDPTGKAFLQLFLGIFGMAAFHRDDSQPDVQADAQSGFFTDFFRSIGLSFDDPPSSTPPSVVTQAAPSVHYSWGIKDAFNKVRTGFDNVHNSLFSATANVRLSSHFGPRARPVILDSNHHVVAFGSDEHGGNDYAADRGTPVKATAAGVIEIAQATNGGYGNEVVINHGNGYKSYYGHLEDFAAGIVPGASIKQGAFIGRVGSTGRSTGAHLHYEVRFNGRAIDPGFNLSEALQTAAQRETLYAASSQGVFKPEAPRPKA